MIARILIPLLLLALLPDLYFEWRRRRLRPRSRWWSGLWWWVPTALVLGFTAYMAAVPDFIPSDIHIVEAYIFAVGGIVVPKAVLALCVGLGSVWQRRHRGRHNWGYLAGAVFTIMCWALLVYGTFVGPRKLQVNHVDVAFGDLPEAFDGYKIVQFSDAHLGTFVAGRIDILQRTLDSINAQQPDLIVFTGDLQNMRPQEAYPVERLMSSLRAKDGVVSVLGNHDYSEYIHADSLTEAANRHETIAMERRWGWRPLINSHEVLRRGADSIVVAGEQNLEKPDSADFDKTMRGVGPGAFVVMLQHNPKAWDEHIRPSRRVALTLSGHVHGGQVTLFGLRPTRLKYKQDYGLYLSNGQALYVSAGIGGLIPLRIGVAPEIAVITLHKKKP